MAEGVELRLADLPARLAEQDVVIGVRVKRRIEDKQRSTLASGNSFRSESHFKLSPKYSRFIQGNTEHDNRFLPPPPYSYGAADDFARNDKRKPGAHVPERRDCRSYPLDAQSKM